MIDTWIKDDKHELLDQAFQVISGLRIWQSINNNVAYQLNETFRTNLQKGKNKLVEEVFKNLKL